MLWRKGLARITGLAFVAVKYGCIAHCTFEFIADFAVCSGPSMLPTIKSNDILLTDHISVARRNISVGDIVICRSMTNPGQYVCKRVMGMEGDRVLSIDNGEISQSSINYIPKGHIWLEGDNKDNSTDSRFYGPVPYGLLRGKAVLRVWPPSQFGWMDSSSR